VKRRQLVNVRLDPERVRKAQMLREEGLSLSDVVREAIDERFDQMQRSAAARDGGGIIRRILAEYPDPPDLPARDYDVSDARAARAAVRRNLRAKNR
jgi:hypothetical protein